MASAADPPEDTGCCDQKGCKRPPEISCSKCGNHMCDWHIQYCIWCRREVCKECMPRHKSYSCKVCHPHERRVICKSCRPGFKKKAKKEGFDFATFATAVCGLNAFHGSAVTKPCPARTDLALPLFDSASRVCGYCNEKCRCMEGVDDAVLLERAKMADEQWYCSPKCLKAAQVKTLVLGLGV